MRDWTEAEDAAFRAAADGASRNGSGPAEDVDEISILSVEEFIAQEESDAVALVGDEDAPLIAEGMDVMFYGDGGAGKTSLGIDLAWHLAAGRDWLQMTVRRPVHVLLIEAEGPRPLYRKKLARKAAAWTGGPLDGRVTVFARPWAQFRFDSESWRAALAAEIKRLQIDVVIAGPLVQLGMDAAGTLQEVRAFMRLIGEVRRQCERSLTIVLAHHENKGGAVSGAWEGAGDTLLHVMAAGNGHTVIYVQKARWASNLHHTTIKLAWTDGEGFEIEGERDLLTDMRELFGDGQWRTATEIRKAIKSDIGAVRDVLTKRKFLRV